VSPKRNGDEGSNAIEEVSESNNERRSHGEGTCASQESGEQAPRLLPLVRFQCRRRRSVVPQIRYFLQTRQIMSHSLSLPKLFLFLFMFFSHF